MSQGKETFKISGDRRIRCRGVPGKIVSLTVAPVYSTCNSGGYEIEILTGFSSALELETDSGEIKKFCDVSPSEIE